LHGACVLARLISDQAAFCGAEKCVVNVFTKGKFIMKFKATLAKVLAVVAVVGSISAPAWSVPVDEYYSSDDAANRSTASVSDKEAPADAEYVNSRASAMSSPSNGSSFRGQNYK
jgi:hypothetical protein